MNHPIVNQIFKAVALAMGIATVVLSILNQLEPSQGLLLLGIAVTCLGLLQFNQSK